MQTEDEVRTELDAARTHAQRLAVAVETARARYRAALSAKSDLSVLDADQLAAGLGVNLDPSSALVAVRELERRLKEAQGAVNELRQELYHAATQPAVDAYNAAVEELIPALLDLADQIDQAQAIKAGVKQHDPRVFHLSRVYNELRATAEAFEKWRAPSRPGSWRVWIDAGRIVHLPAEEYERRDQARLEKLRPRRRSDGALSGW